MGCGCGADSCGLLPLLPLLLLRVGFARTDLGLIYEWFYDFSRQLNVSAAGRLHRADVHVCVCSGGVFGSCTRMVRFVAPPLT